MFSDKGKAMEVETTTEDNKTSPQSGEVESELVRIGTSAADDVDDVILRANGHDAVLKRQFRWFSAIGLAFSITNSWIGYLVSLLRYSPHSSALTKMSTEQLRTEPYLWRSCRRLLRTGHCLLRPRHHFRRPE